MITYGFSNRELGIDLDLACRMGATCLEILPDWGQRPAPGPLRTRVEALNLTIHSAHACWGRRTIEARRVDLADPDSAGRLASQDDVARCADWLAEVGGRVLVVHPGGLSDSEQFDVRRDALAESLLRLADHVVGTDLRVCVENMPPGVFPGSRMADLASLVTELDRPELALALDTGHAHIASTPAVETLAAGPLLHTTHVHDNDGRKDVHDPPGLGTLDWDGWIAALDVVGYRGPVMLECIRYIRGHPDCLDAAFLERLDHLTHGGRGRTHAPENRPADAN